MPTQSPSADEIAIRALIREQAARLSWTAGKEADWNGFKSGFVPGAMMIASGRPARLQSPEAFVDRMKSLSTSSLRNFEETALGGAVHVFGNVAVALVAGETLENGSERNRDVSGYLLVKENGQWRIAAQAWDKETSERRIPEAMSSAR